MTDASKYHRGTWINAKHAGTCAECGADIFRGEAVLYVPKRRALVCRRCAS